MSRVKRKAAYFSLAIFGALAGYLSFGSSSEKASNNVNPASEGEMAVSRIAKYDADIKDNHVSFDEGISERFSITAQEKDEEFYIENMHQYDYLYDEPEFHHVLEAVAPISATLLTHYAQLQPASLSTDQSKEYLNSESYAFLLAMMTVCEKCAFGYMFYEKYALGRSMSYDEYKTFAKSPEFDASIEAAMSIDEYQQLYNEQIN